MSFRITHLLKAGKNLHTIHKHRQFTLLGTRFDGDRCPFKILFKLGGKTCR